MNQGHTVAKHTGMCELAQCINEEGAVGHAACDSRDRMLQRVRAQLHMPVRKQEFCTSLILFLHLVPIEISAGTPGPVTSNTFQEGWVPDGENQKKAREKDHSSLQFFLN